MKQEQGQLQEQGSGLAFGHELNKKPTHECPDEGTKEESVSKCQT